MSHLNDPDDVGANIDMLSARFGVRTTTFYILCQVANQIIHVPKYYKTRKLHQLIFTISADEANP